jgi:hypothetical protein
MRHFHITARARPRRTAFIIDPLACSAEFLTTLFMANYRVWGGRLNPIVPLIDGRLSASCWALLRYVDPDVVYTYVDLPEDLIAQITRALGPSRGVCEFDLNISSEFSDNRGTGSRTSTGAA